jgi:hypothetical protein
MLIMTDSCTDLNTTIFIPQAAAELELKFNEQWRAGRQATGSKKERSRSFSSFFDNRFNFWTLR